MDLLLGLILLLQEEPKKADLVRTKLYVFDAEKGMTLRVRDDGAVELTVREGEARKTYSAESVDELRRRHPDVLRKSGASKHLPGGPAGDFDRLWEELGRNRRLFEFKGPAGEEFDEWMKEQFKLFDDLRKGAPAPAPLEAPAGRELGITVDGVGETMRDQLGLKEGEGLMVSEVKPGSTAARGGLQRHDLILKVDGKAVGDRWQFRRDVLEALGKGEFDLELLRAGKRQTLRMKSK
jgi:hypothetical protein